MSPRFHAIHFIKELTKCSITDTCLIIASLSGHSVNLIEENDGWRAQAGLSKDFSDRFLCVSHILTEELGALNSDKVEPTLCS